MPFYCSNSVGFVGKKGMDRILKYHQKKQLKEKIQKGI
jgi:hypothetical protein